MMTSCGGLPITGTEALGSAEPWALRKEADMSTADAENKLRMQRVMLAGTLGLAMAQRAAEIFSRHVDREQLTRVGPNGTVDFDCTIPAPEGAVFTEILEAANGCLGVFDRRPPAERRWDALLQILDLAVLATGEDASVAQM